MQNKTPPKLLSPEVSFTDDEWDDENANSQSQEASPPPIFPRSSFQNPFSSDDETEIVEILPPVKRMREEAKVNGLLTPETSFSGGGS